MTLPPLPSAALRIARLEAFVLRAPVATPVQTSFGVMHDRPAVFVRVEDSEGAQGWGEAWCNFPSCGAEHRARLLETVLAPLLTSRDFDGPVQAFDWLSERTAVLALQSGEPGPMAQAISAIDLALWDLCARRAGQPLWAHLGGRSGEVAVYASGINPTAPEQLVAQRHAHGYRSFKLKVGFGTERDLANLRTIRQAFGDRIELMVDANQAWNLDEALAMAGPLADFGLRWLEEPLRADRPWSEWQQLARGCPLPLAAGENLAGGAAFDAALDAGAVTVFQPDVAKWGGISGCWPVISKVLSAGRRFCPHYLGGGVGLLHSAHLLAATGGDGLLEVDANANPLRSELAPAFSDAEAGRCLLGSAPGIGPPPDILALQRAFAH
ncbi:mandelate racemase/muconate lactonizing enzyme family protein [Ramlibacter rhizophilus]|uniref:Mandelate racemase/muconate lactonizing enzyme family protein n=1 Tax=Ramlibacter rhizophilus TaxID=1781167 RepID=A0A4Z0C3D6_9BURK|nr:mandelate racemase/muconate lactonizing enzyme family protein [Ramlibacter rhizophilus]TFZ04735.1 mandelate racemase/muconate lactonizing enzyme family protein [Ramlibacter rhizophilus]